MDIAKKIEKIRQQPEYIRLRWVWGSVIFSMLIIFTIWLFSITVMFRDGKSNTTESNVVSDLKNQAENNTSEQLNSLKDFAKNNSLTIDAEGVSPSQGNKKKTDVSNSEPINSNPSSISTLNQSESYTKLGNQSQ